MPEPTNPQSTKRARLCERAGIFFLGALGALGFVRLFSAPPRSLASAAASNTQVTHCAEAAAPAPHVAAPLAASITDEEPAQAPAREAERVAVVDLEERSEATVGVLEQRITALAGGIVNQSPEHVVNTASEYMFGTLDALAGMPEMVPVLSEQIERALCDERKGKSKTLSMMYMRAVRRIEGLATARGFECFFAAHKAEDAVLWEGLQAIKGTGIELPAAVAALAHDATLPQTRRYFLSRQEFEELRRREAEHEPVAKPLLLSAEDLQRLAAERAPR